MTEPTSAYLELLKKILIDEHRIGTFEYHPLPNVEPNWKTWPLHFLDKLLRLRNFALVKLKKVDADRRMLGGDWPAQALSMIGKKRMNNIEACIRSIQSEGIEGDLMETGVWRGGACIFMKACLNEFGMEERNVWLADSFEGLPSPNLSEFPQDKTSQLHKKRILKVSQAEVEANFKRFGLLDEKVKFLQGWFKDSLPKAPVEKLALLRLDGDLYESTFLALQHLYPKLGPGGFLIVDDYHAFTFCKAAVDDFRQAEGITTKLTQIDKEAVFWRKEK